MTKYRWLAVFLVLCSALYFIVFMFGQSVGVENEAESTEGRGFADLSTNRKQIAEPTNKFEPASFNKKRTENKSRLQELQGKCMGREFSYFSDLGMDSREEFDRAMVGLFEDAVSNTSLIAANRILAQHMLDLSKDTDFKGRSDDGTKQKKLVQLQSLRKLWEEFPNNAFLADQLLNECVARVGKCSQQEIAEISEHASQTLYAFLAQAKLAIDAGDQQTAVKMLEQALTAESVGSWKQSIQRGFHEIGRNSSLDILWIAIDAMGFIAANDYIVAVSVNACRQQNNSLRVYHACGELGLRLFEDADSYFDQFVGFTMAETLTQDYKLTDLQERVADRFIESEDRRAFYNEELSPASVVASYDRELANSMWEDQISYGEANSLIEVHKRLSRKLEDPDYDPCP